MAATQHFTLVTLNKLRCHAHLFFSQSNYLIRITGTYLYLFVCVEVLRPSQPNGAMSSAVSLPNHTFTGQAKSSKWLTMHILSPETDNCPSRISGNKFIYDAKQCRSKSVGFFRSQLIWIYTVCKDSSARLGLTSAAVKSVS